MPFMEFVRASVTESAANTFTETETPTPASKTEKLAMLIHFAEIQVGNPDVEDAQENDIGVQITDRSETAIVQISDTAALFRYTVFVHAGSAQGSLS